MALSSSNSMGGTWLRRIFSSSSTTASRASPQGRFTRRFASSSPTPCDCQTTRSPGSSRPPRMTDTFFAPRDRKALAAHAASGQQQDMQ
ncbi:MAG: hypothetical protein A2X36_01950 [Elusimicrobia bacterium GWA2_69_24]|nr:MAG: hypothetical protein A2X36_01950 [Elusimicrobia bacterium GWA2_69_24]